MTVQDSPSCFQMNAKFMSTLDKQLGYSDDRSRIHWCRSRRRLFRSSHSALPDTNERPFPNTSSTQQAPAPATALVPPTALVPATEIWETAELRNYRSK
ncbi:hypothetical protein M0804_000064 [Polistes exclamans]|nr:hypothetical protein M0804_000064 [Polistes exclamans]